MKARTICIIFFMLMFGFTGCENPFEDPQGPEILSLTTNPSTVNVNQTAILTCVANHPEGYPLNYIWVAPAGAISGSGASVTWYAPGSAGEYTVICQVVDSHGKQATQDVRIHVESR